MLGPPDDLKGNYNKHITKGYLYSYDEGQLFISLIKIQGIDWIILARKYSVSHGIGV